MLIGNSRHLKNSHVVSNKILSTALKTQEKHMYIIPGVTPRRLAFFACVAVCFLSLQREAVGKTRIPTRTYTGEHLETYSDVVRDRKVSMTAAERTRSKLAREKRASARPQEHRGERERKHDMKSDTSAADKLTREKNVRMRQQSSKAYQKRVTKDRNNRDNITARHKSAIKELKEELKESVGSEANVSMKETISLDHEQNEIDTSLSHFLKHQARFDYNRTLRFMYGRPSSDKHLTVSRYRWSTYDRRETQACPAHCSGHGLCEVDKCVCSRNWHGVDCSRRTCPAGPALVDSDGTRVYAYAECSGRGTCDYDTGECKCMPQFEGHACTRTKCPAHNCNGHGTCVRTLGTTSSVSCKCDPPYYGPDCFLLPCPRGDDPMTFPMDANGSKITATSKRTYNIHQVSISSSKPDVTGWYTLSYAGPRKVRHETRPIPWMTYHRLGTETGRLNYALRIRKALLALPGYLFPDVKINLTMATNGVAFFVTFNSETGNMTTIDVNYHGCDHVGCQPRYTGLFTTGKITVTKNDSVSTSNVENVICSNRGLCHPTTGTCTCFHGFHGFACETEVCRDL